MLANATEIRHPAQELRRDKRFQVSQAAIITQPGHTEIACEIRDFCLGGLFLKFTNPEAAIASLAKRADAEVEIVFTPASLNAAQTFRVPAQLTRLSPLGVGVAFARQPVDALRALQKLRMAGHRQKLAALPASHAHTQLREASTALLSETLLQVHDQMIRMLGDKLSTAAMHASGIAEHSGLLGAVHEFGKHAAAVQTRFVQQVLDALRQARPVQTQATRDTSDSGLALVDELDFEDWLATSSEANKLEELFREQLADIEPRVGQLFSFACDHSNNPFGPAVIGHAYRSVLQDVPVPARARQVAYAALRDALPGSCAAECRVAAQFPSRRPRPLSRPRAATRHPFHRRQLPAADAARKPNTRPLRRRLRGPLNRLKARCWNFPGSRRQPRRGGVRRHRRCTRQGHAVTRAGCGGHRPTRDGRARPAWPARGAQRLAAAARAARRHHEMQRSVDISARCSTPCTPRNRSARECVRSSRL